MNKYAHQTPPEEQRYRVIRCDDLTELCRIVNEMMFMDEGWTLAGEMRPVFDGYELRRYLPRIKILYTQTLFRKL